jgi:hypothetical protein
VVVASLGVGVAAVITGEIVSLAGVILQAAGAPTPAAPHR